MEKLTFTSLVSDELGRQILCRTRAQERCHAKCSRGDDARPFLRQRDASGMSEVTHTSAAEMCPQSSHRPHLRCRRPGPFSRSKCPAAGLVSTRWRPPKHRAEGEPPRGRSPPAPGTHHHRRRFQSTSDPLPQYISHSRSFDHRRRTRSPLTAIVSALRCPTSTTSCLPRVTPAYAS